MRLHSLFTRFYHFPIHRWIALTLVAVAALPWSNSAFCQIHEADQKGDLEKVKALLKYDPKLVFSKDVAGQTPLHVAAAYDRNDVAELLLAYHADVNATDNEGLTPLYWAVEYGHSLVELLLVNHADPNTNDDTGVTLLDEATRMGQKHLIELLIAYKADVNAYDNYGITPLHMAAAYGRTNETKLLLANHADVSAKAKKDGRTPLHVAAWKAWPDVAELLLDNHADVNARDDSGHTPLHLALNG